MASQLTVLILGFVLLAGGNAGALADDLIDHGPADGTVGLKAGGMNAIEGRSYFSVTAGTVIVPNQETAIPLSLPLSLPAIDNDPARRFILGGAWGYAWPSGLRAEAALRYDRREARTGPASLDLFGEGKAGDTEADALAFGINSYYGLWDQTDWRPFLGLGFGVTQPMADQAAAAPGDNAPFFYYQAGAGMDYHASPELSLSLDYRYLSAGKPERNAIVDGKATEDPLSSQNFLLTGRYRF